MMMRLIVKFIISSIVSIMLFILPGCGARDNKKADVDGSFTKEAGIDASIDATQSAESGFEDADSDGFNIEEAGRDQYIGDGEAFDAIEELRCGELQARWYDFIKTNQSCFVDKDCVIFRAIDPESETVNACNAPAGLQAVLNVDSISTAERYFERYVSLHCGGTREGTMPKEYWTSFFLDAEFMIDPKCAESSCQATIPNCH